MPEATQQFIPVQGQSGAVSVGRAPAIREDPTTARLLNFANEMNLNNIKNQRAEMYLEGQIEAAQNEGVASTRKNQPWVETLFGGGARLSGAMDYMEKTKVMEYQEYLTQNMSTLRTQRPEQFKQDQLTQIQSFLTDDAEVNKRIMQTFSVALPDIARKQAQEFLGYEQERHVQEMTKTAHMALTRFNTITKTGTQGDVDRQYPVLAEMLSRPPGMLESSYKDWLYSILPAAAEQGNPIVMDILTERGMITSPSDIEALAKADESITGYTAEQETLQFGVQHHQLEVMADNPNVSQGDLITAIYATRDSLGATGNEHFTSAMVSSLLDRHFNARKKADQQTDYGSYLEMFRAGQWYNIPTGDLQKTLQLNSAELSVAARDGNWDEYARLSRETINGYKVLAKKDNVLSGRWSSSLVDPLKTINGDLLVVSGTATQVLAELDMWHEEAPSVLRQQLDEDSAAFYTAYRLAREGRPNGSPAEWVSEAQTVRTRGAIAGRTATERGIRTVVEQVQDAGDFSEDVALSSLALAGDMQAVAGHFATLYDDPKVAAAAVNAHLHNRWEVHDGIPFVKVHGQGLAERVGATEPLERLKGYLGRQTWGWDDVRVTTLGTRPYFEVRDMSNPDRLLVVPFSEVKQWHDTNVKKNLPVQVTATQEKNRRKLEKTVNSTLLTAFQMQLQELPIGYGAGQRNDPARTDDAAERRLAAMSFEEKLDAYKQLRESDVPEGTMRDIGKWFAEQLPEGYDPENPPPDFATFGVFIGKMLGYNKEREDKMIQSVEQLLEITGE